MTIDQLQILISTDETRTLELKKTTGELKDGMHSACAFLNTDGGWLIFGVAPGTLTILGQEVTDSTRREIAQALTGIEPAMDVPVEYIDVPDRPGRQVIAMHFGGWAWGMEPYTYHARPYYKVESTTKVMPRNMYDERLQASNPAKFAWESKVADGVEIADLDETRIRNAVRLGIAGGRINASAAGDTVESILGKFKLMKDGKLLNAAVMLFGKDTEEMYPQLQLRMACFRGVDKDVFVDNKRVYGNFFDLFDAGMEFCFSNLKLSGEIVGVQREERLEIPVGALREALTNALCHRQYDSPRTTVSLAIYRDRVEIVNPGRFPVQLNEETIKGPHESYPYNLKIAKMLYLSTFLESWGLGVKRMMDLCSEQSVPEPEYKLREGTVAIVFRKDNYADEVTTQKGDDATQKTTQKGDDTTQKTTQKDFDTIQKKFSAVLGEKNIVLTQNQLDILTHLYMNPQCTRKELQKILTHITVDGVQYSIGRLQELKLLSREGGRKLGHWVVLIEI